MLLKHTWKEFVKEPSDQKLCKTDKHYSQKKQFFSRGALDFLFELIDEDWCTGWRT